MQHSQRCICAHICCELVTFYYLWHIEYNAQSLWLVVACVVNWLHYTIFDILNTTQLVYVLVQVLLWIGYIILSLTYWIQPAATLTATPVVVNWLHYTIFDILNTTLLLYSIENQTDMAFVRIKKVFNRKEGMHYSMHSLFSILAY